MAPLAKRIRTIIGINRPLPYPHFIFYVVATIATLQFLSNYLMLEVNLGLGAMVNEVIVIMGLPLILAAVLKFDLTAMFPLIKPHPSMWPSAIIVTLGMVIIIDYLTAGSEMIWPLPEKYRNTMDWMMAASTGTEYIYKLFLLCLVPAFCEELFFRGFCQTTLASYRGNVFGILVTGAIFALLHGNPWYMHLYFVLGCFLSWTFAVTRTLWIPILCHFINNAWTFTNHTLDTTLPWQGTSIAFNAAIIIAGAGLLLAGILLLRKST